MKKIILMVLLALPMFAMAQSEWELPDSQKPTKTKEKAADKTSAAAEAPKSSIEEKYAFGAVPEVDGRVVFEKTIQAPGLSADVLYDRVLGAITDITKEPKQRENSRISAVNKNEHIVAASLIEEMVFSSAMLAKDFCDIKYTLIATCHNGSVDVKFFRISYEYDKGRATEATYTAEEWITDKEAINKKGTKMYRNNGKFRKKTIDRKDEVFGYIESKIKE